MKSFIDPKAPTPKYQQLVQGILEEIRRGNYKINQKLPSVNQLCVANNISRDTVLLAYNELKNRGIIEGRPGKGYYVCSTQVDKQIRRIFLLFDELNGFKEKLYNTFIEYLPDKVKVDLYFHYFNEDLFQRFIEENRHRYDAFVIMPVWFGNIKHYVEMLSPATVVMLDQWPTDLEKVCSGIYQDFYIDMKMGLEQALEPIRKYKKIWLLHPGGKEPTGMKKGAMAFAKEQGIDLEIIKTVPETNLKRNELYIVVNDIQLSEFCQKCIDQGVKPGKEIGLISYNDSPFKPFIFDGISTISTDFSGMGRRLAELLFAPEIICEKNPAKFNKRRSI